MCYSSIFHYNNRRRVELHLLHEPSTSISDADLVAFIREIQASSPHIGQSLLFGRLWSMGYKVTRERVREALQLINPFSSVLRWPGVATQRRPYSVPGPNSLWHIGILLLMNGMHYDCMWAEYVI